MWTKFIWQLALLRGRLYMWRHGQRPPDDALAWYATRLRAEALGWSYPYG
jgi:hypothetical protein